MVNEVQDMSTRRLLVIDDEAEFREIVSQVATGLGYEVVSTGRADEFKTAYDAAPPTAIVLDMIMPDVDGIELVRWLADRNCPAKVLVVTGYNPLYRDAAGALGSAQGLTVATLQKPVSLADLRAALR
jgi:CheY-like chemotaxis protein